jgi:hypothetical protein
MIPPKASSLDIAVKRSSLVYTPISKEASPASILGWVWCDVSSRTCLAGLSALWHKEMCVLFYSRVLRVV